MGFFRGLMLMVGMSTEGSVAAAFEQVRKPISRAQMEVVASRSVAMVGLLFGAQTLPVMLGQAGLLQPVWLWVYNVAIFGGLLAAVVAAFARRFVQPVNAWIAIAYVVAMAVWPLAIVDSVGASRERPWLWFLCTIATAAAAIAFSRWVAALYLFVAPTVYGLIRLTPAGGGASWELAALDTVYAILLGGAVLTIITMLRDAAASVDAAQATALARYSHAVRQHATEVERVHVDSIVHDSVLTTLISAARAYSPEAMTLSASMARNAIGHLSDAAAATSDDESMVGVAQLADRISHAARALPQRFTTRVMGVGAGALSVPIAEALFSASVQAMHNSLQHAGTEEGTDRWLRITGVGDDGLEIEVGDTGVGFDVNAVPLERLGVRVSIVERMYHVGGETDVTSRPGEGTVVSIRWPAIDADSGEVAL